MKRRALVFTNRAIADRTRIADWLIANGSKEYAMFLDKQIVEACEKLKTTAHIGRLGRITGTRELVIHGTRYIAVYRVMDSIVRVLRVIHTSQSWPRGI